MTVCLPGGCAGPGCACRLEPEVDLFGEVVEPPDPTRDGEKGSGRSDGRRRTERQAELIKLGQHPMMSGPLHELADRTAMRDDGKELPYRCGSCVHRIIRNHGAKTYPKCDLTPMSHSEASDVRAWWPACPSYQPIPKESPAP